MRAENRFTLFLIPLSAWGIRMRPSLPLRAASIVMLLFAIGHSSGGLSLWSPAGETDVLRAMRAFHFDTLGVSRSYLDFYIAFGYTLGVYQLLQAIVFWQLATLAKTDAARIRPLIGAFLLAAVASTALAWRFLFVIPVVFCCMLVVCLAFAFHLAGKQQNA